MTSGKTPSGRASGIRGRHRSAGLGRVRSRTEADDGDSLLRRYLPRTFYERLPVQQRWWRGRAALLLWALGYPLEMAWSLAMTPDDQQGREFERLMARLDDDRLIAQLDSSAATRGDGSHLEFVSFGVVRNR